MQGKVMCVLLLRPMHGDYQVSHRSSDAFVHGLHGPVASPNSSPRLALFAAEVGVPKSAPAVATCKLCRNSNDSAFDRFRL
mmetsp:Transcript_23194/g.50919  ORF Transcript_23194/g.50919 Transcript_23194/m.50919 type:complete len:81 (+) Transcript_23194:257-499(+)